MSSNLKATLRDLSREGFTIEKTKKHIKVRTPTGQLFVCSSTPSCPHAHKNLLRDIRRHGR